MLSRKAQIVFALALICGVHASARAYDALEACRLPSPLTDDIHNCLDNYLDLIDKNLSDLTLFIDGELQGSARSSFGRAQQSFYSYRRENCLWYLEISGPRVQAEQVAKNCLAQMSQKRLAELRDLISSYTDEEPPEPEGEEEVVDSQLADANSETEVADDEAETTEESNEALADQTLPEDGTLTLDAYFGQWQVSCQTLESDSRCILKVLMESAAEDEGNENASLSIIRGDEAQSVVELNFPEDEIDSYEKLSWRIDNYTFGSIPGSSIRVDEKAARQIIHERKFLRDDLLPLFRNGNEVGVTVLEEIDGDEGVAYSATLVGLSRALSFSDQFISGELQ